MLAGRLKVAFDFGWLRMASEESSGDPSKAFALFPGVPLWP